MLLGRAVEPLAGEISLLGTPRGWFQDEAILCVQSSPSGCIRLAFKNSLRRLSAAFICALSVDTLA
jgi:hypothetical protein